MALALGLISFTVSQSAYAGIPCTDDGDPETTMVGCIHYIPDGTPLTAAAEAQAGRSSSIEVQYYEVPAGEYGSMSGVYLKIIDHRDGRTIGTMSAAEFAQAQTDIQMNYNNFFNAALTGQGNSRGFQYMPSVPALGGTVLTTTALVAAIRTWTRLEVTTGSTIITRTFVGAGRAFGNLFRRVFRRAQAIRGTPTRVAAMGAGTMFMIYLAYMGERAIYDFYKDIALENHWFDPASQYVMFLNAQLLLTQNCLTNTAYCPQLIAETQSHGLLDRAMASTQGTADVLREIEARQAAEARAAAQAPRAEEQQAEAPTEPTAQAEDAPAEPITRPGMRHPNLDAVANAYRALFRAPCTDYGPSCLNNMGRNAGFRRPINSYDTSLSRPRL
jgi:hypothetical protein